MSRPGAALLNGGQFPKGGQFLKAVIHYDEQVTGKKEPLELHKVFAVVNTTAIESVFLLSCESGTKQFEGAVVDHITLFPE